MERVVRGLPRLERVSAEGLRPFRRRRTPRKRVEPIERRIEQLARQESTALLAYFTRRVSPAEDAADLLGEVLLVMWRRAASVPTDDEQARMWLFGVARNVLSTYQRGVRRRIALAEQLRSELLLQPVNARMDATSGDDDLVGRVTHLIAGLAEIDREIVTLHHWEGLALVEIASVLGMQPGTVRSRYSRLRANLRQNLD